MSERRSDPEDGAASRPCWASPSSPASPGSVGPRPHTRWAPGPGPGGARGSAARPSPVPGCPALRSGLQRCSGPPSAPSRPSGPRPPLAAGPSAARASPAASRHRSLRPSLAGSAFRRGALRLAPAGAPPGGPRLRAGPRPRLRPLAPLAWLRAGPLWALRFASPFGALRAPCSVALGPSPGLALRARPRPGSPLARPPPAGGGSSPCGARPGLVAPGGRRGPAGRFWRLCRPPGLGTRGVGLPPSGGNLLWNDGHLRGTTVVISAR